MICIFGAFSTTRVNLKEKYITMSTLIICLLPLCANKWLFLICFLMNLKNVSVYWTLVFDVTRFRCSLISFVALPLLFTLKCVTLQFWIFLSSWYSIFDIQVTIMPERSLMFFFCLLIKIFLFIKISYICILQITQLSQISIKNIRFVTKN